MTRRLVFGLLFQLNEESFGCRWKKEEAQVRDSPNLYHVDSHTSLEARAYVGTHCRCYFWWADTDQDGKTRTVPSLAAFCVFGFLSTSFPCTARADTEQDGKTCTPLLSFPLPPYLFVLHLLRARRTQHLLMVEGR